MSKIRRNYHPRFRAGRPFRFSQKIWEIWEISQIIWEFQEIWEFSQKFWEFSQNLGKLLDCNLLENGEDSFYDFSICYVYDAKRSTYHVFIQSGRIATIPRPAQTNTSPSQGFSQIIWEDLEKFWEWEGI